jgi:hypothetical protein
MTKKKQPPRADDDDNWPNTMRHHKWEKRPDDLPRPKEPDEDPPEAEPQADGWGDGR